MRSLTFLILVILIAGCSSTSETVEEPQQSFSTPDTIKTIQSHLTVNKRHVWKLRDRLVNSFDALYFECRERSYSDGNLVYCKRPVGDTFHIGIIEHKFTKNVPDTDKLNVYVLGSSTGSFPFTPVNIPEELLEAYRKTIDATIQLYKKEASL